MLRVHHIAGNRHRATVLISGVLLLTVAFGGDALAAEGEGGSQASATAQAGTPSPDFLFGRPAVSVGVRAQWHLAPPDSEIIDFTTEQLTVERNDFRAPGIGVDLGVALAPRLDALFGVEFSRVSAPSELRGFVEDNGLPIQQTTTLRQVNLSGSVELALLERGREVGQYAWIPRAVIPYVGAGGGLLWYQFAQEGDFVDIFDLDIFTDRLTSSGWTPSVHVFGGVDIKLTRWLYLSTELRYLWAKAGMKDDYIDFDDIDLSSLRVTSGIQVSF